MKSVLVLSAIFLVALCAPQQKYSTKYDNVDLNQILKSDRLLRSYVNCLLDKGRCSPDGQELKTHIGDALLTSCQKCSDKQRDGTRTVIRFLMKNKRDWWTDLEAKYDPNGVYTKKYRDELKAEGINV